MKQEEKALRRIVRGPILAWAALCLLLLATIGAAYVPMGAMNLWIGLAIAGTKATIIALVFMELARGGALLRFAASCGLFWLSFLFVLMFADYLTR